MPSNEPYGQRGRFLAAFVLLAALVGLLFWYGMLPPYDPTMNDLPDEDDVGPDPNAYVGQQVVLGGNVVDTDPVVVEVHHEDDSSTFTFQDADDALETGTEPLEVDDSVTASGTLTDDSTLEVDRSLTREPWELQYMYVVSFLGGLWVLGRFFQGWQFDRSRLAFVARADDSETSGGDVTGGASAEDTADRATVTTRGER